MLIKDVLRAVKKKEHNSDVRDKALLKRTHPYRNYKLCSRRMEELLIHFINSKCTEKNYTHWFIAKIYGKPSGLYFQKDVNKSTLCTYNCAFMPTTVVLLYSHKWDTDSDDRC